jgi:hypothetical protein
MPKTSELTISKATAQTRRLVDKIMPGVMATVESKRSYDLAAGKATIVTTITHPEYSNHVALAQAAIEVLGSAWKIEQFPTLTRVTRDI